MFDFEETSVDDLVRMELFGRALIRASIEIKSLRKELAAFERVRKYLSPTLVNVDPPEPPTVTVTNG